jgi:chitodextrinase
MPAAPRAGTAEASATVPGAPQAVEPAPASSPAPPPAVAAQPPIRPDRAATAAPVRIPPGLLRAPAPAAPADTVPPTAPAGIRVSAPGERQVVITWDAATDDVGVAAYEVVRDGAVVARVAGRAVTDSGLSPGQSYCYSVRALDAAGNASPAAGPACAATPDLTPPTAPAAVAAAADGEHAVRVRWEASADDVGVTAYELLRDGRVVSTSTDPSAVEERLAPAVKYCYEVRARDAAGNRSRPGGPACATTPDLTPPSVPQDVVASAASDTRVELRWAASRDEVGVTAYEVFRDRSPLGNVTQTSTSESGLRPGREYCYYVRARDAAGNLSPASRRACATTPDVTPPTAPTHLAVAASSPSRVALAWGPATDDVGVARYEIRRGDRVVASVGGRDTRHVDGGLPPETEACYAVFALDAAGNRSPAAGPACATTPEAGVPTAPSALDAHADSLTSVRLAWTASPDPEVVYAVYRDGGGRIGSTPRTTYTAVVRPGDRRCYQVAAVDAAGRESPKTMHACAALADGATADASTP